jgi:DNA-binding MarR family transcriptional regulator
MTHLNAIPDESDGIQERYRDNFARHLMGVALYLQSEIMHTLIRQRGHRDLRINFESYITMIGNGGARLSDIAEQLCISRQAANQTANQIEAAGYIVRLADPRDGRAKLLALTERGDQLRAEGTAVAASLQDEMERFAGRDAIRDAMKSLGRLSASLKLLIPRADDTGIQQEPMLAALLPRLRDYINDRLMQLTIVKGHPDLKHSFGQVLTAIGPRGGRIQQMAAAQEVSKQAISAVANELEDLGYIHRVADSSDARQVVLLFTGRGRGLIADSVTSVDELQKEFADLIGPRAMGRLAEVMRELYGALHLEEEIFGNSAPVDIRVLASQLTRQLGEEGARALGQMLLSPIET